MAKKSRRAIVTRTKRSRATEAGRRLASGERSALNDDVEAGVHREFVRRNDALGETLSEIEAVLERLYQLHADGVADTLELESHGVEVAILARALGSAAARVSEHAGAMSGLVELYRELR